MAQAMAMSPEQETPRRNLFESPPSSPMMSVTLGSKDTPMSHPTKRPLMSIGNMSTTPVTEVGKRLLSVINPSRGVKSAREQRLANLQVEIFRLQQEQANLTKQAKKLASVKTKQLKVAKEELNEIKTMYKNQEKQMNEVKQELTVVQDELENTKTELFDATIQIQQLNEGYDDLVQRFNTTARRLNIMMGDKDALAASPVVVLREIVNNMPDNFKVVVDTLVAKESAAAASSAAAVMVHREEEAAVQERCLVCTERLPNMLSLVCQRMLVCNVCSNLLTHCVHCNVQTDFVLVHRH